MLQQMRANAKWIWLFVAAAFVGIFLFAETSGLLGKSAITPTTAVAVVNGQEIFYRDYEARVQQEVQAQQQRSGQSLSQDDIERIRSNVFDQMVSDILLEQEYRRRGIFVSDEEIQEYARVAPPPQLMQAPELQTEGRFDINKYQRYLASPQARQAGVLAGLEQYYRTEVPRQKLLDQLASGVYVTDAELWRIWRDQHDSAQVSYVAFRPRPDTVAAKAIPDGDLKAYFDKHKDEFKRPGRAVLTVVELQRRVTPADSAASRTRADSVRNAIARGAKFEDVAKQVSADTASGSQGGDLGRGPRGRFVKPFEDAAYALKPGELSQPVLSPFGYHIIRVDERKGDTLALRHILIPIQMSDTASQRLDRRADSLSRAAASSEQGAKLDSVARKMGLIQEHVMATEGEPATFANHIIPSVSAWAFGGAHPGETSELFDDQGGYYLARLDSLAEGGQPDFDRVKDDVRRIVAYAKGLDKLAPAAQTLATTAASSSLASAAAQQHLEVQQTPMFTRGSFVPGLGQFTTAVGAAFGVPEGTVTAPVRTDEAIFVEQVLKRVKADSATFEAQKGTLRAQRAQQLRQQRVQMFMEDLRKSAKIDDRRKQINASARRVES